MGHEADPEIPGTGEAGVVTVPPADSGSIMDEPLRSSFRASEAIVRQRARNFWYGLRLTPEPRRSQLYAVYAWMRAVDDLADEPGPSVDQRRASLGAFRDRTRAIFAGEAPTVDPVDADEAWWNAFSHVVATRSLDIKPFEDMIEGQILDLEWEACRDRAELEQFCRLVASTVGDVCVSVWGHDGHEDVPALADARGLALQMTNVLRDLREDHERGRVYLPADELDAAGLDMDRLLAWRDPARCEAFLRSQIEATRAHYDASASLEAHLEPGCRATSWAMCEIYRGLLDRIAANPRQVVEKRVRLGSWRKARIAFRARRLARAGGTFPVGRNGG